MCVPLRVINTSISNQNPLFKYVKNSRDHFGILKHTIIVFMEESFLFVCLLSFVCLFCFLAMLCSVQDHSSSSRDPPHAPCNGSVEF